MPTGTMEESKVRADSLNDADERGDTLEHNDRPGGGYEEYITAKIGTNSEDVEMFFEAMKEEIRSSGWDESDDRALEQWIELYRTDDLLVSSAAIFRHWQ